MLDREGLQFALEVTCWHAAFFFGFSALYYSCYFVPALARFRIRCVLCAYACTGH